MSKEVTFWFVFRQDRTLESEVSPSFYRQPHLKGVSKKLERRAERMTDDRACVR